MKNKLKDRIKELYKEYCENSYNKSDNEDYIFRNFYTEQDLDQYVLKVLVDLYAMLEDDTDDENRLIYHDWDIIEPTIELILEEKDVDKQVD